MVKKKFFGVQLEGVHPTHTYNFIARSPKDITESTVIMSNANYDGFVDVVSHNRGP